MTCYAFAYALLRKEKKPSDCPSLLEEKFRPALEFLEEALGKGEKVEGTDFIIDKEKCHGCGICDVVCRKASTVILSPGLGKIFKRKDIPPPVFRIADGVVTIANWSSCRRVSGDTLCKVCVEKCPFGALALTK
jgi:ferredoxin